jgi:hypothetical protein
MSTSSLIDKHKITETDLNERGLIHEGKFNEVMPKEAVGADIELIKKNAKIHNDKLNKITGEIETINKHLTSENIADKSQVQALSDAIKSFTTNIELIGKKDDNVDGETNGETNGDVINLWIDNFTTIFNLGEAGLGNTLFNGIAMPILETGGIDKELLNYVLTFLKNPTIDRAGLEAELANQALEEAERMKTLFGKSGGDVAFMLSQALARTALFTIYPGIGETITKLNMTLGQIKEKIEQKFGLSDKLSVGITDVTGSATASLDKATNAANKAAENTLNNAEEAANKAEEAAKATAATGKGGSPSKKINKTKVKRRIHNSIRKFYKTNNLKTLKREIQRMKKRFTRGNK